MSWSPAISADTAMARRSERVLLLLAFNIDTIDSMLAPREKDNCSATIVTLSWISILKLWYLDTHEWADRGRRWSSLFSLFGWAMRQQTYCCLFGSSRVIGEFAFTPNHINSLWTPILAVHSVVCELFSGNEKEKKQKQHNSGIRICLQVGSVVSMLNGSQSEKIFSSRTSAHHK